MTETSSSSSELVKSVILALLINCQKPRTARELQQSIKSTLSQTISEQDLQTIRKDLIADGYLEHDQLILTERGEREVLRFLALSKSPSSRTRLGRIKLALLAVKLGKPVEHLAKLDKQKLAALILKQNYELPPGSGSTLNAVLEALTCKLLGYPDAVKLQDLIVQKLSEEHHCKYDSKTIKSSAVATLLGISQLSKDKLIQSVLARSSPRPTPDSKPEEVEEFDRDAFVSTVLKAAREVPTGRFREDIVFINHVWHYLSLEPPFRQMSLKTFKDRLIEANREQKLCLIRADFPANLNPKDIEESACEDLGSWFHFIQLDRDAK